MNKEDFQAIKGYFNDWVDLPQKEQNSKINALRDSGELTAEQFVLLVDLLASDSQDNMPEDVNELALDLNADFAQQALNENAQLGNYRLLKLLGSGGMGFVYLAERNDGTFDKQVAIKFSKIHFKKSLIKRFENERQILAKLTHPNIAQLLDGGTDEQERPYIVMEYVRGQPINQYCSKKKLNTKQRLQLILQVCSAVAFAHQNLVLHRDLKPDNILVDETGLVKLLDFGIATLLSESGAAQGNQTMTQIMTRNYASPEQIKNESLSTLSDQFSLAVICFELLVGFHPFDSKSSLERDQNVVSGKIRKSGELTAKNHVAETDLKESEGRKLSAELENILRKALSPEPKHRYSSVGAFAEDINNFLHHRPVKARKPSAWYAFKKLLQRHKTVFAVSLVAIVLLITTTLTALYQANLATAQQLQTAIEADKAKRTAQFLINLFDKANPSASTKQLTAQDLLLEGYQKLQNDTELDTTTKFDLINMVYRSMVSLNLYEKTLTSIEDDYVDCVNQLGANTEQCQDNLITQYTILSNQRQSEEALAILQQAEAIALKKTGTTQKQLLDIYDGFLIVNINLGHTDEAMKYSQKGLAIRKADPNIPKAELIEGLHNFANGLIIKKRFEEAFSVIEEIPPFLDDTDSKEVRLNNWRSHYGLRSFYYGSMKDSVTAAEYRLKAMNIVIENFENNTSTAAKQYMYGGSHLMKAGEFTQGIELFNHALAIMEDTPENYQYPLYRIYLEMALMAIHQNNNQAYLEFSQKMHATGFQPKAGNYQDDLMVWMDTIWAIKQGQGEGKDLIESLTIQLTKDDGIPEYNQMYLNLAQATLSFNQKDYQQAQHFNELALAYWEKLPRHYLHFKYYAEQLNKKIKNS